MGGAAIGADTLVESMTPEIRRGCACPLFRRGAI